MTIPKKLRGTSVRKNYSRVEKIKALKRLEANNFNLAKTSQSIGVSVDSLRRWSAALGEDVFGKQPRADIAVRVANSEAELRIIRLDLQKRKEELAHKSIDILQERLRDPKKASKISISTLIEIIKLPPVVLNQPCGADSFSDAINRLARFEMDQEQCKKNYKS